MSAVVVGLAAVTAAALAFAVREHHRATHDQLTGLLNRRGLTAAYDHRAHRRLAVLLFDLDRFKEANDLYGHAAGDEVLATVATRLRCLPGVVARLGGDEYVALVPAADRVRAANAAAGLIAQPITLTSGDVVQVHAAIGVSTDPPSLRVGLAQADQAMYQAKTSRYRITLHTPARDDMPVQERPALRTRDLRHHLPTATTHTERTAL